MSLILCKTYAFIGKAHAIISEQQSSYPLEGGLSC